MSTLLQLDNLELELRNFNNDFLILSSKEGKTLQKIGKAIFQEGYDFVEEVIVAETEICVKLNQYFDPISLEWFQSLNLKENTQHNIYKLPVYFNDHEDWIGVKTTTALNKSEIIRKLTETELSIAMFGFLPGFAYLKGIDVDLHVPRKTIPSKYVKANSLAMGGKYLGIYSIDSPGGWHVIGQLPISILDLEGLPPVALNLEDKVQLESIGEQEYERLSKLHISLKEYNA